MKIVHDVPGDRLTLEGEGAPKVPPAVLGCLAIVLLPFLLGPIAGLASLFTGPASALDIAISIGAQFLWFGAIAFGVLTLARRARVPFRLDLDRSAGELRLAERSMFGKLREHAWPLTRLRTVAVRRGAPTTSGRARRTATGEKGMPLDLAFELTRLDDPARTETRSVSLAVEDLDQPAEVADFAFRLGAAAGLPFSRVVRNDPRAVEIELSATRGTGWSASPSDLAPADYARDAVAPAAQAALAHEKVAPFEPERFPCDYRVEEWAPGTMVRLRKPFGFAALGCLPFTLLLLAGPAVYAALLLQPRVDDQARMITAGITGFIGLVIGSLAVAAVVSALPRRLELDWSSRAITVRRLGRRSEILPMDELAALELRNVHRISRGKNSTTHWYHCELLAHRRNPEAGAGPERLLETTHFREDADGPYRAALPLATELARALHVERRITEG